MKSEQTNLRYPHTWEANLLVAAVSILVLIGGMTAIAFGPTMLAAQAFVILPALLWIAIRRYPVRTTLRLHPIDWRIAMWSALIGLAY